MMQRFAFHPALEARPGFLSALERLADLDIAEGHLDAARQTVASVAAAPGGHSSAELALGVLEERTGRSPDSAVAHYRQVLQESPDNITALNNLAYHLTGDPGHADEALKLAQVSRNWPPIVRPWTIRWAGLFYNTGAYELATVYLKTAFSKQSKPSHGYRLAMAYLQGGIQGQSSRRPAGRDEVGSNGSPGSRSATIDRRRGKVQKIAYRQLHF